MSPSLVGQTLGHYRIDSKLGEGGMGAVWKARDTHLDRYVALKTLPPEKLADQERRKRFVQEAKAASALNHPNIVHIYDIADTGAAPFIAMEYVAGKTLDQWIGRKGLRLGECLRYAIQIADALARAHSAGIIHRDLKPSNIMVDEHGLVKLLDFGLAKLTEKAAGELGETATIAAPERPKTEEGAIVGTVAYMSPEQAEGKPVDPRSDIFSFGSVLYEIVTGQRAFRGDSKLSTLSAILKDDPKPVNSLVPDVPRDLEKIISRCLRKDPVRRFQHMDDVKVALDELKEESESGALGAAPSASARRRPRLVWLGLTLVLAAAVAAGIWHFRSAAKPPEAALTAVPLTTYTGFQQEAALSPDGNQVAFTWNGEKQDNWDIYIKLVGTGAPPLRLTTDPALDLSPAWSPDGRFIAFLRWVSPGNAAVLLIPALGGPERKVVVINLGSPSGVAPYLDWSPDGKWLAVSDRASPNEPAGIVLLAPETGEKHRLTSAPAHSLGDYSPAWSPDGRFIAFSRDFDTPVGELYLVRLSGELKPLGEPQPLTQGNRGFSRPTWTPDGHGIVFSTGVYGEQGLWRIDHVGFAGRPSEPRRFASVGDNVTEPVISRRASRLVYTHNLFHWSIWRMAAPVVHTTGRSDSSGPPNKGVPFILSTRDDDSPQFSPDGKKIAFVSDRSGNSEIWVCNSDASNTVQVTSFGGPAVTTPRWSPDGERIAFDSNAAGEFDVWVVSATGGKPERMTTHPANDGDPSWSRDGKWIYFDSARAGQQQVFKIPANGGEAIQVTRDGGFAPRESLDGKFLYYTKALTNSSLWKMPIDGGQAAKVLDGLSAYLNLAIAPNGVYFVPVGSGGRTRMDLDSGSSVRFLDFGTGQIRLVADVQRPFNLDAGPGGLAVSPDGRWILYTQFDQAGSELMLVENFR